MTAKLVGIVLTVLLFASETLVSQSPIRFRTTPTGGTGYDTEYGLDGWTGDPGSSGTGTETTTDPSGTWNVKWSVTAGGDLEITCTVCGKTTTLKGGTGENGAGTRKHDNTSTEVNWTNIDFS